VLTGAENFSYSIFFPKSVLFKGYEWKLVNFRFCKINNRKICPKINKLLRFYCSSLT
jgi:hypothetical protein